MATHELICSLELELLKHSVRSSKRAVSGLLANEFVEFGRSGEIYNKEQVIDSLSEEEVDDAEPVTAFAFKTVQLAPDVVLLTYRSMRTGENGNHRHSLRSSIWKLGEDGWRMIFHQGTPTHDPYQTLAEHQTVV